MSYNQEILPSAVLHWNYRGFTEFPIQKIQGEESTITDIYLKENLIANIPKDIYLFENLESLYLSGNDITELPKEISRLRCLKCLDVSGNRLKRIPDEIGDARNLKFLIFDENELCEIPLRLSELRYLRYLSVCDNQLQWLPQKPVYNYHHCEFRFWRNSNLRSLPYSLWYHMFRDQQTRSLNIGCLSISNNKKTRRSIFQLKLTQDSRELDIFVDLPPNYKSVLNVENNSPPSLFEISKRIFYHMIDNSAKRLTQEPLSLYSNEIENINENNNNLKSLENEFDEININGSSNSVNNCKNELRGTGKIENSKNYKRSKSFYAPRDIIDICYDFLPAFIKTDLINGPISRCENCICKKPIFDYVFCEFSLGKLILIDNTDDVILSAVFCSKSCADLWKTRRQTIPWTPAES